MMRTAGFSACLLLAATAMLLGGCQSVERFSSVEESGEITGSILTAAHIPAGSRVSSPFGFVEFCQREPAACKNRSHTPSAIQLTETRWRELNDVNDYVNQMVPQITDRANYDRAEFWAYPNERGGDCEDLALEKRKLLMARGWPMDALLLAIAREWNGDAHVLLLVATETGDYVLDNKNWAILRWNEAPYVWEKHQSHSESAIWNSFKSKPDATTQSDRTATALID